MLGFLRVFSKTHRRNRRTADAILRAVLTQARNTSFYEAGDVADTVTGRFDLLALHAFLVMRAMRHDPALKDLNQAFLDALFANIDTSFRNMGVSDPRVPKKMRQAAEAFYGRLAAYESGLADGGLAGLEEAIERNLYRGAGPGPRVIEDVARYMIGSLGTLALLDHRTWTRGKLAFASVEFGARL